MTRNLLIKTARNQLQKPPEKIHKIKESKPLVKKQIEANLSARKTSLMKPLYQSLHFKKKTPKNLSNLNLPITHHPKINITKNQ
jgi:hypothetical protein